MSPRDVPLEPALARALELARERRAQLLADEPLPVDTAHRVTRCARCGELGLDARGYPGGLRAVGDDDRSCDTVAEIVAALAPLFDPAADADAPGEPCPCGAPASALAPRGVRFFRALAGTGAELLVEGTRADDGAALAWRFARVPLDGVEQWLPPGDADDSVAWAFGRPLAPAQPWRRLFGPRGERVDEVEHGHWVFAGPAGDPALEAALGALTAAHPERVVLGLDGPTLAAPAFAWLRDLLRDPRYAGWVAGAVIDLATLRHLLGVQARRFGLALQPAADGAWLARRGELGWPVEVATVAREGLRSGYTLGTAAAAAVASARGRLDAIEGFLRALRALREGLRFAIDGTLAVPLRPDGSAGLPFDLGAAPFREYADALELDRDLRFHLDERLPYADPGRVCACGAALVLAARLVPWAFVDALIARRGQAPVVVEVFARDAGREAAAVVALECDRHLRHLAPENLAPLGLEGDALVRRLEQDRERVAFGFRAAAHADAAGRRALIAHGSMLGSVVLDPRWVVGLHQAAGAPLAAPAVEAWAVTPDVVVLHEPDLDPAMLPTLGALGLLLDPSGRGAGGEPLSIRTSARLDGLALGRFQRLDAAP